MQNYTFPGIEMQSIIDQISCFCLVTIDQISHLHDQLHAFSCTIGGGWLGIIPTGLGDRGSVFKSYNRLEKTQTLGSCTLAFSKRLDSSRYLTFCRPERFPVIQHLARQF